MAPAVETSKRPPREAPSQNEANYLQSLSEVLLADQKDDSKARMVTSHPAHRPPSKLSMKQAQIPSALTAPALPAHKFIWKSNHAPCYGTVIP